MTIPNQGELFRQAADKESLAADFMRYAEELDQVFSGLLAQPQAVDAFWKGPAAGRFTAQAVQLAREIRLLRENCVSTAERLRRQAELTRTEAAQLSI
ncbi:WXG100 family type VII secretion target [Nonomuraea sp. NPDC050790]|uniref:WXG100 family type VII secretion target n=1 Tax=Nonomuraea sp. NPDC050790 TaxID=3364371 RepID=UPI00379F4396